MTKTPTPSLIGDSLLREALDLLDILFTAYEEGTPCYEDPEEHAGYLGNAFVLDEDTAARCADLLNRERPRATPPAPDAAGWEAFIAGYHDGASSFIGDTSAELQEAANIAADRRYAPPAEHEATTNHIGDANGMVRAQPWSPVTEEEVHAMDRAYSKVAAARFEPERPPVALLTGLEAAGNALLALRGGVAQGGVVDERMTK